MVLFIMLWRRHWGAWLCRSDEALISSGLLELKSNSGQLDGLLLAAYALTEVKDVRRLFLVLGTSPRESMRTVPWISSGRISTVLP